MYSINSSVASCGMKAERAASSSPWPGRTVSVRKRQTTGMIRATTHPTFFDRAHETGQLEKLRFEDPADLRIVLGPRNCGKSSLFQHFLKDKRHAVYMDCRNINADSPRSFVVALLGCLATKASAKTKMKMVDLLWDSATTVAIAVASTIKPGKSVGLEDDGKIEVTLTEFFKSLKEREKGATKEPDMNTLFTAIRTLLNDWKDEIQQEVTTQGVPQHWPVLIIDEANVLMELKANNPEVLRSVLRFFTNISKQDGLCQVLMGTSEYSYQSWLSQEIGPQFWLPVVIGDFEEHDARNFLMLALRRKCKGIEDNMLSDDTWSQVYEVCGGNAGNLKRLASQLTCNQVQSSQFTCEAELEVLLGPEIMRNMRLAGGGEGYTCAQFTVAALKVLDSEHYAVPHQEMQVELGKLVVGDQVGTQFQYNAGQHVLQSLVAANALSLRPFSNWACDIPAAAFKGDKAVVMAPSTMDLFCLKKMKPDLLNFKEQLKTGFGTPASLPADDNVGRAWGAISEAIKEVENQIADTVNRIKQVQQLVESAKEKGDKEELAVLRMEMKQLWRKEEQLRKKEEQLREQQTILLRQKTNAAEKT